MININNLKNVFNKVFKPINPLLNLYLIPSLLLRLHNAILNEIDNNRITKENREKNNFILSVKLNSGTPNVNPHIKKKIRLKINNKTLNTFFITIKDCSLSAHYNQDSIGTVLSDVIILTYSPLYTLTQQIWTILSVPLFDYFIFKISLLKSYSTHCR